MKLMLLNAPSALLKPLANQRGLKVVALDDPGRMKLYPEPIDSRIKAIEHRTTSKLDWWAILNLRLDIAREQPDVIHAFWNQSLANAVVALTGLAKPPKLISYRGIQTIPSRWDPSNHLTFLNSRVALHACESDAVREGLIGGGIDPAKCHTIYNCVQPQAIRQLGRRGPFWRSLNIPQRAFVVCTIATIRPVKGIDLLLEAALRCSDLTNVYWLVIGPNHDPRVKQLAADPRLKDRLRMIGYHRRAADFLKCADVFVMPSRQEALCRALLEAMSQGCCPVVSTAGGMKELVRDGQDGLVFPIDDVAALEASLRRLQSDRDLVRQLGSSAAERVMQMCSPEKMAERAMHLYRLATETAGAPIPVSRETATLLASSKVA